MVTMLSKKRKRLRISWTTGLMIIMIGVLFVTLLVHYNATTLSVQESTSLLLRGNLFPSTTTTERKTSNSKTTTDTKTITSSTEEEEEDNDNDPNHKVAGLSCEKYGGPINSKDVDEMIYWRDIPSDSEYISPLKHPTIEQYLTFEPDEGGWNNIRMGLESAIGLAVAMGRTLVLPPKMHMYRLWDAKQNDNNIMGFNDFFHFNSIVQEHKHTALKVISFDEFLNTVVMTGKLIDPKTNKPTFPPNNRTDWTGAFKNFESTRGGEGKPLWEWMRSVIHTLDWSFDKCVVGLPEKRGPSANHLNDYLQQVLNEDKILFEERSKAFNTAIWQQRYDTMVGNPTAVNASSVDRLREILANRQQICIYNETIQNINIVHGIGETRTGYRLLIHFYAFLFYENWSHDIWMKRFIRDHFRYIDSIQCAAARIIASIRQKSREHNGNNNNDEGLYNSMHIRRGDFQYKDMHMSAEEIYNNNTKFMIEDGSTVFIATDEKNKTFFNPLKEHYNVYFLDDFLHLVQDVNPNYYGMLDQLIASKGEVFIGAFYSTFTGYINRLRGYHAQKYKLLTNDAIDEHGTINSYYYVPKHLSNFRNVMKTYHPVRPAFWMQEFAVSWRDIDFDVKDQIIQRR